LSQTVVSSLSHASGGVTPGRIFVVRHAATQWSKVGRHTGRTDLPLEPDGEVDAIDLGRRVAGLQPGLVLSSPLRRALDTCALAGFGDAVETTDVLLEMDYGEYEGLSTAQIRELRPGWDLFSDGCPGGETMAEVGARADLLIERLTRGATLAGADVLVFGHGHILRALTARWLGFAAEDARRFALQAGTFGVLGWEHEWSVLSGWNL
jgi:probable phosphoglycerate mutase